MNHLKYGRIVFIDSSRRSAGTSSNFQIELGLPDNPWDSVVLMQCSIPKSWHLISTGVNDSFRISEPGISGTRIFTVTIPKGSYNKLSLASTLSTIATSASSVSGYALTYNIFYTNTNINNTVDTFTYTWSVTKDTGYNFSIYSPSLIFGANNFAIIVGFNNSTTYIFPLTTAVIITPNAINLSSKNRLFLKSSMSGTAEGSILQEIYQSVPDNSIVYYNQYEIQANTKPFSHSNDNIFSFVIQDRFGNVVDLNGLDCVFSVFIYQRETVNDVLKSHIQLQTLQNFTK